MGNLMELVKSKVIVGVYEDRNGEVYNGTFKDNKRHGQGVIEFNDGSKYEGEYIDDTRNGHGTSYNLP